MTISLMPLPYALDALEPAIGKDTLSVHHGKHHKAYVDKTNELTKDTKLADASLEDIIAGATDKKLFNQAAQVWNHGFYWVSMTPDKTQPSDELAAAIDAAFGSHDAMAKELGEKGLAHFGSGWIWLLSKDGKLSLEDTHDAGQPPEGATPLLVVDLWEHAYYLDRKNERKAYLEAVTKILNWDIASSLFESGERWTYPA